MDFEVSEIKALRKKLGMSQSELAKNSGVSQSLVAKIESGRLDPSYSNAKKIFDVLTRVSKKEEAKVESVLNKKVISVSSDDTLKKAIEKMRKHEISQLPVMDRENVQGLISESIILNNIDKDLGALHVSDVMDDPPPIISKNSSLQAASAFLKHYPMILVSDKGKIEGIVTKADIIASIGKTL